MTTKRHPTQRANGAKLNGVEALPPPFIEDDTNERAVLGCLIDNPDATIKEIGGELDPKLFGIPSCAVSLRHALDLLNDGHPLDVITLTQRLREAGELDQVGGPYFISHLQSTDAARPASVQWHLDKIKEQAARRELFGLGNRLRKDCEKLTPESAILEEIAATRERVVELLNKPQASAASKLVLVEFKSPSELRAFTPPNGWNLVGNYHVQRGSPFVIGGAPGVGKSRAATALAVAGATGADWFGLPVHQRFRTMILQAENGPVRLRDEYASLDLAVFDDFVRVCPPPRFGFAFNDPDFCEQLQAAIAAFSPDVFIVDPWNRAAADDKSKDYLETFNRLLTLLPTGEKAPALGIVAHTRKPAAGERTNGRGLLNILAGGYALGSVPRSAFVIQHASDEPTENRVVFTCCKNNDGQPGERTAWVRANGLFQSVEDFDWQEFDTPDEKRRVVTSEDISAIFAPDEGDSSYQLLSKKQAVDRLVERTGCKQAACYRALDPAGKFKSQLRERSGLLTLQ